MVGIIGLVLIWILAAVIGGSGGTGNERGGNGSGGYAVWRSQHRGR